MLDIIWHRRNLCGVVSEGKGCDDYSSKTSTPIPTYPTNHRTQVRSSSTPLLPFISSSKDSCEPANPSLRPMFLMGLMFNKAAIGYRKLHMHSQVAARADDAGKANDPRPASSIFKNFNLEKTKCSEQSEFYWMKDSRLRPEYRSWCSISEHEREEVIKWVWKALAFYHTSEGLKMFHIFVSFVTAS